MKLSVWSPARNSIQLTPQAAFHIQPNIVVHTTPVVFALDVSAEGRCWIPSQLATLDTLQDYKVSMAIFVS